MKILHGATEITLPNSATRRLWEKTVEKVSETIIWSIGSGSNVCVSLPFLSNRIYPPKTDFIPILRLVTVSFLKPNSFTLCLVNVVY